MGATIVSQGSVVKRFAKNQSGFSLTEILVALGIFSIVLGGSATLMSRLQDSQKQMLVKSNLIESKETIMNLIGNQKSWEQSIQRNPSMSCLAAKTCTNGTTGSFDLYDSNGNKVVDSSNPSAGMTADGSPCNSFGAANSSCDLRPVLTWTAVCGNNCEIPEERVTLELQVSPKFKIKINKDNYGFRDLLRRDLTSQTAVSRCASSGKLYVGNAVTQIQGYSPDSAGCIDLAAFSGNNGNNGSNGYNGNNGANGSNGANAGNGNGWGNGGGTPGNSNTGNAYQNVANYTTQNTTTTACGGAADCYMKNNPDVWQAYYASPNSDQYKQDAAKLYGVTVNNLTVDQMAGAHYALHGQGEGRIGDGLPAPQTTTQQNSPPTQNYMLNILTGK